MWKITFWSFFQINSFTYNNNFLLSKWLFSESFPPKQSSKTHHCLFFWIIWVFVCNCSWKITYWSLLQINYFTYNNNLFDFKVNFLRNLWYMCWNTYFQFLYIITHISTQLFIFPKNTNHVIRSALPYGPRVFSTLQSSL